MSKRVHEIAKERGLPAKEVLEKLRAAGINVKAVSSSVDEAAAAKALGNGAPPAAGTRHSVSEPPRADENTIEAPSGVHAGSPASSSSKVSRRALPPATGTT